MICRYEHLNRSIVFRKIFMDFGVKLESGMSHAFCISLLRDKQFFMFFPKCVRVRLEIIVKNCKERETKSEICISRERQTNELAHWRKGKRTEKKERERETTFVFQFVRITIVYFSTVSLKVICNIDLYINKLSDYYITYYVIQMFTKIPE